MEHLSWMWFLPGFGLGLTTGIAMTVVFLFKEAKKRGLQ